MFQIATRPSQKLYEDLNKNKDIKKYFGISYVGSCISLITNYYKSTDEPTFKGWEKYYADIQGWAGTKNVKEEICKLLPSIDSSHIAFYIYERVIVQTWNGHQSEIILVKDLKHQFPNLTITRAAYEIDVKYFIDIEVREGDKLLLGIQLKPHTYKNMSSPSQLQDKQMHYLKNEEYKVTFEAPYKYVYYNRETCEFYEVIELFDLIKSLMTNANSETCKW